MSKRNNLAKRVARCIRHSCNIHEVSAPGYKFFFLFFRDQNFFYADHFTIEGCQKATFWKSELGALSDSSSSSAGSNSSFIKVRPHQHEEGCSKSLQRSHCRFGGVCEKYHNTLTCVLGHSFIYGSQEEKEKVSKTISEIVNLVRKAKGLKERVDRAYLIHIKKILNCMCVPDWVLLYFKLKARLPDNAWQILLNVTLLGKRRVCKLNLHNFFTFLSLL